MNDDQPETKPTETALECAERVRAERKAKLQARADEQRAIDIMAINALEEEHGDSNIVMMNVPYTPGLPTCVAARTPTEVEIKRYRYRVNGKKVTDSVDPATAREAAEELADVVRVYPARDADGNATYAKLREARSQMHAQLGAVSTKLATAREELEGKT